MSSKVYLIGCGPGALGLITLKAVRLIKEADVIVYDRLISPGLLNYAKDTAEFVYVGKAASNHTKPQEEINSILVNLAKEGKSVARLKGGDPFVFGRGGEEAQALQQVGVPFEIVPGVTSSIAAPAYAGIPVTHRDFADSFHVITGHKRDNSGEIDFKALAKLKGTLIFMMGVSNLSLIVNSLLNYGKDPFVPAALIEQGTTGRQKTAFGVLINICEKVEEAGIKSPAVIIIGKVASLHEQLDWREQWAMDKPLYGTRIAVTRAREQGSALSEKLTRLGAEVFEFPLIKMQVNDGILAEAVGTHADSIAFTSQNAVKLYFKHMQKDIRSLQGVKFFAVGSATYDEIRARGIIPEPLVEPFTGSALARHIREVLRPPATINLIRSRISAKETAEILRQGGFAVNDFAAYDTVMDGRGSEEFKRLTFDFITFTSSSTVKNFIEATGIKNPSAKTICIGDVTANTAKQLGLPVTAVADVFTIDGLIQKIVEVHQNEKV